MEVKRPAGFFNLVELQKKLIPDTESADCNKCGLFRGVRSPIMSVTGLGLKNTLIIGEAPGETEDIKNIQFIGKAGQILRTALLNLDFDLDRDFWKINSVNCRPTKVENGKAANRAPTKKEVSYCRPTWKAVIKEKKPRFILLLGAKAVEAFFGDRKGKIFTADLSIGRWRRLCIPDPIHNAWVIPILHPSFTQYQSEFSKLFNDDIKWATSCLSREAPVFEDELGKIDTIKKLDVILGYLESLNEEESFAYDFETNCLKPYYEKAQLFTVGISIEGKNGFSFPYQHPGIFNSEEQGKIAKAFSKVLTNPNVRKIVQNRAMEELWSREFFTLPVNLDWDTMIASHIVEERDDFTGLKFQSYINWGIVDYDKEVEPYKSSVPGTLYNRFNQVPWDKLCLYNGMDAMLTRRLEYLQKRQLRAPGLNKANKFLQDGMVELTRMTHRGIPINTKYYEEKYAELENGSIEKNEYDGINVLKEKIEKSPEALQFKNATGKEFDMNSTSDLRKLFFDVMKLPVIKTTAPSNTFKEGQIAVDADVLERLDTPIAKQIVQTRKLKKIQDYAGQMIKLACNGLIHPDFNLHLAKTYRSSSSSPNFQNIPKRDKFANKIIRSGIMAPEGQQILAADFGAMEVRGFAWYSKDPTLVRELTNHMDPHAEWADFLGLIKENPKEGRFDAKNGFVFPLIYGSYYKNITRELKARGYKKINEELVRVAENKFWAKYHYARAWQEKLIADYYQNGYVETYLGFRRRGVLSRNQIVNYPIQSTCFHMLVWSFVRLAQIREEEGWEAKQDAQIHDENLFLLPPEEVYHVGKTIEYVMVNELMEEYPWINTPPLAEFKMSKVGGSWYEMFSFTKEEKQSDGRKIPSNPWEEIKGKVWQGWDDKMVEYGSLPIRSSTRLQKATGNQLPVWIKEGEA